MIRSENLRSGYIQDDVEEYIYKLLPERDPVVKEMEDYAEEHRIPIIGPAVARLLAVLVQVAGAQRVFEMGSAIGYSTVWLARAAGAQGKVFYSDGDPEKAKRAEVYFRMAGVAKRIEVQVGDALALVKKTPGKFDLIFIDANKSNMTEYFDWAVNLSRRGSVIIADNVIREGLVLDATSDDANIQGVRRFNERLASDQRVCATEIQTVGTKGYDGFALIVVL